MRIHPTVLPPSSGTGAGSSGAPRRSRSRLGVLATALVVTAGLVLTACSDDGTPGDAFYTGIHDELTASGLDDDTAGCIVDAVRALDPTDADATYFEKNGDFPAALSARLDDGTRACLGG